MKTIDFFKESPSSFWLIVMSGLMSAALWSIAPFLTYYFVTYRHIDVKLTSLLIGLAASIQFGGSFIGGIVAEKFGLKLSMVIALAIRSSGYFLLISNNVAIMFLGVFLVSGGAVFYMPAARAYLAYRCKNPQQQILAFSLHNSGIKLGMILGPLMSAPFINTYPKTVFLVSGLGFVFVLIVHMIFLQHKPAINRSAARLFAKFYIYLKNKALQKVLFFYMMQAIIFTFFQTFMAVFIGVNFGIKYFSYALALYSVTLIITGPILANAIGKHNIRQVSALGFVLVGIGFSIVASVNLALLYVGVFVFAIGDLLVTLKHESTASFILHRSVASAVSLWRLAAGIGIFINSTFAGTLYHYFDVHHTLHWFWLTVALLAFCTAFFALIIYNKFKNYMY